MKLSGYDAFSAIHTALRGNDEGHLSFESPALGRLYDSLKDENASEVDRAVLIRQVLVFEGNRTPDEPTVDLAISKKVDWSSFGIETSQIGERFRLRARPWTPEWLQPGKISVDSWASTEESLAVSPVDGDPFLLNAGFQKYRSRAQRSAVRTVLSSPTGATIIIVLATGEGKSTIFRLIDKVGFAHDTLRPQGGVTVVIVPTVALALDLSNATEGSTQRAWYSGSPNNALISTAVRDGTQGLCFISPEAACGSLRPSLLSAAKLGLLKALVIDEAHMVDAWGTGFRTDFQSLSGLHAELSAVAPPDRRPRTVCLTATLTANANDALHRFFPSQDLETFSVARLRPEPQYWFAPESSDAERSRRVIDAMHHLPRPAILYVTKVNEAEAWGRVLLGLGFTRLRVMHGGTPADERQEILTSWSLGKLDIVVATSAFGLGINYGHVRSIVHACIPETLDRYYQEVGRGGRDGKSCISIVIPAFSDLRTAERLNRKLTIGVSRAYQRWQAMFASKRATGRNSEFAIRLDISPSTKLRDLDMLNDRSTDWNNRVLALMSRAQLIDLLSAPVVEESGKYVTIKILNFNHLDRVTWDRLVAPVIDSIAMSNSRSLSDLLQLIRSLDLCAAESFLTAYPDATPVCTSCAHCRNAPKVFPPVQETERRPPWKPSSLSSKLRSILDDHNKLVVELGHDGPIEARILSDCFHFLTNEGCINFVDLSKDRKDVIFAIQSLRDRPAFVASDNAKAILSLPLGPQVLLLSGESLTSDSMFAERQKNSERILFVTNDVRLPSRPTMPLRDIYAGRILRLVELHGLLG